MAQPYVFTIQDLSKIVPPKQQILSNISLSFLPGAKIGVIGPNGSGKSTLLRIIAGVDKEFNGEAWPAKGITIGFLQQEPQLDSAKDVRGNVEEAVSAVRDLLNRFEQVSMALGETSDEAALDKLLAEQGRLQDAIEASDGWELDRRLEIAMDALRLPPGDAAVDTLSGGERRRVALCRILLSRPDLLLLDEPTNHLDAESVAWLVRHLGEYPGTVIAVTHDRYFLDDVAGWILELDRGRGYPFKGNYTAWLEQKEKRLAQEEKQQQGRLRVLARELEWVRASPRARQAKSKARLAQYEDLRRDAENFEGRDPAVEISFPPGQRLGEDVLVVKGLRKGYGDRLLLDNVDLRLPRGGIVGVVGPNGAGKTTLFKLIAGLEQPDAGTLKLGETVQLAYVDQSRDALDGDKTVWEEISDGQEVIELGKRQISSRAYASGFNFRGSDQQKRVCELSGGERNRVHLAKLLRRGANFLLLDEPSNDLDVETLRALEDAVLRFPGCVMVISHDRWFLDRVATHILAFEDDGQIVFLTGNYQDYDADRHARLGAAADQPHRLRHRRLTR
ncbi:MAG: energy-dependent translational throttle protein EttA [Proteobacteria bacterium]|nr:energy-dependent translational throttle protein EttA [Pseudomonadota bacterium]